MYKLRRFYLDAVGVPAGRFVDFTVDLTGADGNPIDTIVWLANGGGKSTMLSLLIGHIRPGRNEFLATQGTSRTLEDLIESNDTTHVAAEWVDPTGAVLLTGAVYEWRDRQRPRDPERDHNRLNRRWWCLRPSALDNVTLDSLPFFTRSDGKVGYQTFCAHITSLVASGVDGVVSETHSDWHAALRQRRFDPELWADIAKMNATEGGIDNSFRFENANDFAKYLLNFIAPPQQASEVRALLADTAEEIAKAPLYEADRAFATEAIPRLEALGAAWTAAVSAQDAHERAAGAAGAVRHELDLVAADKAEAAAKLKAVAEALEAEGREASTQGEQRRRYQLEYQRLDAELAVSEATQALNDAQATRKRSEAIKDAWDATDAVVREDVAVGEHKAALDARDAAAEEAAPLIDAARSAGAALAAALTEDLHAARRSAQASLKAADKARLDHDRASRAWSQATTQRSNLEAERAQAEQSLAAFARAVADARAEGLLSKADTVEVALERAQSQEAAALRSWTDATQRVAQLREEIAAQDVELAGLRETAAQRRNTSDAAAGRLDALRQRADELAATPRIRLVAVTDQVDVLSECALLTDALRAEAASSDRQLLALRAEAADDERALHGLDEGGLLPPSRAVEAVLAALAGHEVQAVSGWQYLAKNVPVEGHARLIAELPAAVAGIVVYGTTPTEAVGLVGGVALDVPVTLVTADVFHDATAGQQAVIEPVAATHDLAEAVADATQRRARRSVRDAQINEVTQSRSADLSLISRLDQLAADVGPGGITAIEEALAVAEAAARTADDAVTTAQGHLGHLDDERARLDTQLGELSDKRARLARDTERLSGLALEDERLHPIRRRLDSLDDEIAQATAAQETAAADQRAAETAKGDHHEAAARLKRAAEDIDAELSALPEPSQERGAETAEELRARHVAAHAQVTANFDETALLTMVENAETRLRRARRDLSAHDEAALAAARTLVRTAEGSTDTARRGSREQAALQLSRDQEAVGEARSRHESAKAQLVASSPNDRRRHAVTPETPTTRSDAQRLASEAGREQSELSEQVSRIEARLRAATSAASDADNLARTLRDLAETLPVEAQVGNVHLSDDITEVRSLVGRVRSELTSTRSASDTAQADLAVAARKISAWAANPRFGSAEASSTLRMLRERFVGEDVAQTVASEAARLAEELKVRAARITDQLDQVNVHKSNVVRRLASMASDATSSIVRAGRQSELPEGIGPWGGQLFFKIDVRDPNGRNTEVVTSRISTLVEDLVTASGSLPKADQLLWRATEAAVGPAGFSATVLKPERLQSSNRVPVSYMKKWSGGEKVTASLLLYCTFARLRAESHHGSAFAGGGVLVMDNPLGKANYTEFLDMQRKVAAANDVQLVFFTGLGDLGAVTRFGRIVAMRKRAAIGTGREYVEHDEEQSSTRQVIAASGTRVA